MRHLGAASARLSSALDDRPSDSGSAGPPRTSSPPGWRRPAGRSSSATPAPATASSTSSPSTARPWSSSRSRRAARAPPSAPSAPSSRSAPASSCRVRRLATAWMSERRDAPRYRRIRFDAVGVTFGRGGGCRRRAHRGSLLAGQLQLAVGDRLERAPVQRRDPEPLDRLAVLGCRVADVLLETPAGVLGRRRRACSGRGSPWRSPRRRRSPRSCRRPRSRRGAAPRTRAARSRRPGRSPPARRAAAPERSGAPRCWSRAGRGRRSPARSGRRR